MTVRSKNKKKELRIEMHDEIERSRDCSPTNDGSHDGGITPQYDVCDLGLILRELREFRKDNKTQLEDIKTEITKTNIRLEEAEGRIVKAEERIQSSEDILAEMLKLQSQLEAKITDLEGRSRRDNIRVYGIPEGEEKDSPSVVAFVEKLLRENLNIPDTTSLQIARAHRALGSQAPVHAQPRSILVKFLSYKTKEMILRAAWQKKGFAWQGKRVNLDNDYAPRILQKRREYAEVRKILRSRDIQFQTLYPARLKVKYEEGFKIYETVEEATQDMARRGLPIEIVRAPETLMEQLRHLTWQRNNGSSSRSGRSARYKEKLQIYRRDPPSASTK